MAIRAKVIHWFPCHSFGAPFGHVAVMLYDTQNPNNGFYISANHVPELLRALNHPFADYKAQDLYANIALMNCQDFLRSELRFYDIEKVMEVRLPEISNLNLIDIAIIFQNNRNVFDKEYKLLSYNCANLVAAVLRLVGYYDQKDTTAENMWLLLPTDIYNGVSLFFREAKRAKVPNVKYTLAIESIRSDLLKLREFAADLGNNSYKDAANTATTLANNISAALTTFTDKMEQNKIQPQQFMEEWNKTQDFISRYVKDADPVLSQHRGYKQIIGNILLGVLMLGVLWAVSCAIHKAIYGKWLLFSDTKTSALAQKIKATATEYTQPATNQNHQSVSQSADDKSPSPTASAIALKAV